MPELHWIHYSDPQKSEETFADDGLLYQGKVVFIRHRWFVGEEAPGEVTALTRQEDPTRFFGRVLRRLHIKKFGSSQVGVVPKSPGVVESPTGWSVGARNPARLAAYHFADRFGNMSPQIWVSNFAGGSVSTSGGVAVGATVHGIGGKAGAGRGSVRVWTSDKDPDLSLELMFPWQSGTNDLRAFAAGYLSYLAPYLDAEEALEAASDGYMPREAPTGWAFNLADTSISLGGGEEATIGLAVSAPTPGRAAFAVRVVEQGNRDSFVVTPIVEIEQTEAGAQEEVRRLREEEDREKARRQHEKTSRNIERLKEKARQRPVLKRE